jgi:ABC-type multidrug transport system fused ATPase/permease subunit
MSMFLQKAFLEETKPRTAGYRYGFLTLILSLFVFHAFDSSRHYWSGFLVPLMLLFNHLAFQFQWSRPMLVAMRACAYFWLAFGFIAIFYDIVRKF